VIDKRLNSTLVGNVAYNSYLAVIGYMDAEWTRAEGLYKPFCHGCDDFISACKKYGADVKEKYSLFCKANHINQQVQKPLDNYLFNPACYVPFGHADGLVITLLDDFDPVHHITAQLKTTLEEICLAFCPTLQSIGVHNDKQIFCELHTLLNNNPVDLDLEHEFQKKTPLLVFTKYKIAGLALLGEGLLFQQALLKAMARKIQETITLLDKQCKNENSTETLILPNDIKTFKCAFLDLQGAEEIGTLMFCSNYSVAMTIVAALRTLTFDDVFKENPHVEKALNNSKSHLSIIKLALDEQQLPEDVSDIKDNHVFRWTYSSLAVSPNALVSSGHANCNGYVEATVELQIEPGHHLDVETNIKVVGQQNEEYRGPKEYHRYKVGVGDIIFAYSSSEEKTKFPLMSLSSVFSLACINDRTFGDSVRIEKYGRAVIDIKTNMTIPIPKIPVDMSHSPSDNLYNPILIKVLRQIQNKLCYATYSNATSIDKTHKTNESRSGKLSIDKLKVIPRMYVLPVSLRRSVEHLYQSFAICIADPFLFDMVLDFYDVFATLHGVLTDYLPQVYKSENNVIDEKTVQEIALLVDVISSAFARRMSKAYPEQQIRDMSIDFRGGLNQILLAADVPVKSSFGLVRKFAFPHGKTEYRDRVGSVTRISFLSGASCRPLNLGIENQARLACFEMDVPHVLHIASYCDSIHESAHLIYYGLLENQDSPIHGFKSRLSNLSIVMKNRIQELFADLITQIFIFGADTAKFMRYKLDNYTKSHVSVGADDNDTIVRFTDELIRLFLVIDTIPIGKKPKSWTSKWKKDSIDNIAKRFNNMVERFGPIFSEYQRLQACKDNEKIKYYLSKEFKDIYAEASEFMPGLWSEAIRIYKSYTKGFIDFSKNTYDCYDEELNKIVEKGLTEGRPIAQSQYYPITDNKISFNKSDSGNKMCAGADPLTLICKLLYQYMPPFKDIEGKAIHLYRDPIERRVDYPEEVQYLKKKEQPWYEFQIDRGAPALFCPVPEYRKKRLLKQIVVIKSFWGLSSSMRLRRLEEIICDNWPELAQMQ
jgi:hypothetical protein